VGLCYWVWNVTAAAAEITCVGCVVKGEGRRGLVGNIHCAQR
jgi:hypothetical protein